MTILITGGAGFIGSHTAVTFIEAGHDIVIVDNLENANRKSLERVAEITGKDVLLEVVDIRDQDGLERVMQTYGCTCVIHFAGLKAVGESVEKPLLYYDNNVVGTQRLLTAMETCGLNHLIFSSSATVYGDPQFLPLTEKHPTDPVNPYGRTKLMIEDMLRDLAHSDPRWRFGILRYFNPVGAHESGLIGENPSGIPNNLMPFITQVASGVRERLSVFGNDYDTVDGTGVRDYIHVVDLARGHLSAYETLVKGEGGTFTVNLGTGTGYSVLQMVETFERASNRTIPFEIASRREGDVASCFADTTEAKRLMNWQAERGLDAMCRDSWNWVCKNPKGYEKADG